MVPIFSTTYSIGRSILTLEKEWEEGGPCSLLKIVKENDLKQIIIVENGMTGFPEANKMMKGAGVKLIYGMRFDFGQKDSASKIIALAKDDAGIRALNKIHTELNLNGPVSIEFLLPLMGEISICVPFYDSFLFRNVMEYGDFAQDLKPLNPVFFVEDNQLPFDPLLAANVKAYCENFGYEWIDVKSIFYENREDAEALQTYKIITGRMGGGKQRTLSNPNLDHFGSREFCWESYLEAINV